MKSANIIGFAGKRTGRELGTSTQDGESLVDDMTNAAIGGGIAGVVSGALGKSCIATTISTTVKNLNTTIDNHENKLLNQYVPNDIGKAAIKTGVGAAQTNMAIASIPGNLITGAVKGSVTNVENITGYKNAAIDNAQKLLESIKTNNIIIDGISSVIVNTVTMPDKILSGTYDASKQSIDNIQKYGAKVVNNAGILLSDVANKIAQIFHNEKTNKNDFYHVMNNAFNAFPQTFSDVNVRNGFNSMVNNRYDALMQNHVRQEVARSNQIVSVFRQQNNAVSQNNARNLYLHNLRQTTSWSSHLYWGHNNPPSDLQIRSSLYNGASISSVAMRYNVPSYIVETVARSMNGVVLGGTYYNTPYNVGSFGSLLMLTGLSSSYNCMHLYGFGALMSGLGWTGGIENDVGFIPNLNPHDKHIFALKSNVLPFSDSELMELLYALKEGIYDYDSFPFYSLHFNNDGFMYPVMHEVYRGTIVGKVIEFLDYIMKGFLNGDIYKDGFAESWHKNPIHDINVLKTQLLKIKDIYKAKGKKYFSLREMLTLYDLDKTPNTIDPVNTVKGTDIQTSFRIIAYQKNIQQHENTFLINPSFRVEYTIDLPPAYKDFLEKYKEQNGQYPKDYRNLQIVYAQFSKTIEEMLPLLPQAEKYFRMLGVINFFCYWFKTLKNMGSEPQFDSNRKINYGQQITALPPLPMRYYEKHMLTMTIEEMFNLISPVKKELTDWLLGIGKKPDLQKLLKCFFETQLKPKTSNPTIDDDILPLIMEIVLNNLKRGVHKSIEILYKQCGIKDKPISEPIKVIGEHKFALLKELIQAKKIIEKEVGQIFEYRKMILDFENVKRAGLQKFIDDSLKPYTAAQLAQNATNIANFKKQNTDNCEKEIADMKIKFCHLLLFGEDQTTPENMQKNSADPEKSKLINEIFLELTDTLTFDQKVNKMWKPLKRKRRTEINTQIQNIIDSLHNILTEMQKGTKENEKELIIQNRYLHSVVEIPDPVLLNSKGEQIRVVGGCGMHIKDMVAEHIPNGTGFYDKVKDLTLQSFTSIDYLGEKYYIFGLNSNMGISETKQQSKVNRVAITNDKNMIIELANSGNYDRYGLLPIHETIYNGFDSIVEIMLQNNPKLLEIKSQAGYTPLMIAAEQGKKECLAILLKYGANIDIVLYNGLFPLFVAIQNGFVDVVLMLLNSPKIGNINRKVDSHMTCLHLAIELNLVPVVKN